VRVRRFIAHLLILSVLAVNVAWAMDDCALQYSSDAPGLTLSSDLPDGEQGDGGCDVPCVGWLHLVAIIPGAKFDEPFSRQQGTMGSNASFHSLDQTPPVRPPQI